MEEQNECIGRRRPPVRVAAHRRRTKTGETQVSEHNRNLKMIKNARAIHREVQKQMKRKAEEEEKENESLLMD